VNPRKLAIADRLANRVEEQRRVERECQRLLGGEVHGAMVSGRGGGKEEKPLKLLLRHMRRSVSA
jgi:hypothetical protein